MAATQSPDMLFVAGAIAGIVTRFHLNEGKNGNVFMALRSIVKEGGFLRFYRGILPELVGNLPAASAMLSSYELFKRLLTELNGGKCTVAVVWGAGMLTSFPEATVATPFQVRMQAKEYLGTYKNSIDCAYKILKYEGIPSLMIGFGPSCWRNCAWNSMYFALMFYFKSKIPAPKSYSAEILQMFLVGSLAGGISTLFGSPFDMVKSRFQKQRRSGSFVGDSQIPYQAVEPKHKYTLVTLFQIWKHEGASAIYKGLSPKILRMTLGGGVCMTSFEIACKMLPNW